MNLLYEKTILGGIEVRNRIVRSSIHEEMSSDGFVTPELIVLYKKLAKEKVGLIISSGMEVTEQKVLNKSLSIYDDSFIDSLKMLTSAVHEANGKIIAQLMHGGSTILCEINYEPMGPSAVQDRFSKIMPKEMSKEDILNVIEQFSNGALRSKKAGFDGVQIQGAFGFLLNKFISPYYNQRTDEYGGSVENRSRILVEIREAIARSCGNEFPVFIELSIDDLMNEDVKGLEFSDGKEIAKLVEQAGYDVIQVNGGIVGETGGLNRKTLNNNKREAYFKEQTIELAKILKISLIATGGIRTEKVAEELVKYNKIEAVSLGRPFIAEPDLIKQWENGEKSKCISCGTV